jgi:transaldolase
VNNLSQLDRLKTFTRVAADTADFEGVREYGAHEGTTNPSLILAAAQKPEYSELLDHAIAEANASTLNAAGVVSTAMDNLMVNFGVEILKLVPGRISTEVDVRLSFDREGSIDRGRHLINLYEKRGIARERVLIKIASTWEGIQAAAQLQKESINCNLTVLFSFAQAVAAAEANVKAIAPYVGRVHDWYSEKMGKNYTASDDPGVLLVKRIYAYYRKFGYRTETMGASFRNIAQIVELAGCDLLTISPSLLDQLSRSFEPMAANLSPEKAQAADLEQISFEEKSFRFELNEDAMATEKMAEAIRRFVVDTRQLEKIVQSKTLTRMQ